MKKIQFWSLLLGLTFGSLAFTACGDDDDDNNTTTTNDDKGKDKDQDKDKDKDERLTVSEENLKGTWDGFLEHDFAQNYYQRWRVHFDGKNYTAWHTHQMVGSIYDDDQSLKTVGNKEQGTWAYNDGKLILTPTRIWASYVITSMSPTKYTYYNYNPETMECDQWYETPESLVKQGVERDLEDGINGNEFYIKVWSNVSLTKTELSVRINRDTFVLSKQ